MASREVQLEKQRKAKLSFAVWIMKAQEKGLLYIDPDNPTIMFTHQSGMFVCGHTDAAPYVFIGIHNSMMPWFMDMPWLHVDIILRTNRIHMVAQMNATKQVTLIIHNDKGMCDMLSRINPLKFKIPYRSYVIIEKNIAWSKKVHRYLPFKVVDKR